MAKNSNVQYLCSECGWSGSKWVGKCPACGQWGTVNEFHEAKAAPGSRTAAPGRTSRTPVAQVISAASSATPMTDITTETVHRIPTGFSEFDRVLGGGIVPGSVVLIAGEPGIGKSTLLLETAGNVAKAARRAQMVGGLDDGELDEAFHFNEDNGHSAAVLYISGEESQAQVRLRAQRIDAVEPNLLLASTTDLSTVLGLIEEEKPALVIVDSAQTIVSQDVDGVSGGPTQVREVASALIDVAKRLDVPVFLVGHVTKDGSVAGPRTLEHVVDVVCQFEGDTQTALRMLRASKNRFGPTDEVGCFGMSGEGIEEVTDPAGLFLSRDEIAVEGPCVTFTVDGQRSLPVEVQSLVTSSPLPTPRRAVNGVDSNRIAMLIAVLSRHGDISLLNNDVYVSTIAGAKAKEPACDLALVCSMASAALGIPIARTTCAIGEISLTGQVRPVPRLESRLLEAKRLGFTTAVVPAQRSSRSSSQPHNRALTVPGMTLIECSTLHEALHALGLVKGAGKKRKDRTNEKTYGMQTNERQDDVRE